MTAPLDDEVVDRFLGHLDDWNHDGVTACRREYLSGGAALGSVDVGWDLVYAGETIGSAQRALREHLGQVYVENVDIQVHWARGPQRVTGIGRAIVQHERDVWHTMPVDFVLIRADKIGSYLWATMGFTFRSGYAAATPEEASAIAGQALRRRDLIGGSDSTAALGAVRWRCGDELISEFWRRARQEGAPHAGHHFASPQDILEFFASTNVPRAGRDVLAATAWDGIYVL